MRVRCSYSKKQLITIRDFAKDKMVVHSGPFGVGKTRCLVEAFGLYCMALKELGTTGLTFVLAGKTQQAVKRNMCNVLATQFGSDFKYTKSNKDGLDRDAILFGQNIYLIGFNDSTSREKFQGITDIMGILHDECTLCTREQFDYAHGRLRGEVNVDGEDASDEDGEFMEVEDNKVNWSDSIKVPDGTVTMWYVGSCNPDAPNHFIKEYIDSGIVKNVKWYMRDAIWKGSKEYYEKLKAQYKDNQAFYSRYLNGVWASADRMVYSMFRPNEHIIRSADFDIDYNKFKRNIISVDYGGDHPTGILLISLSVNGIYIVSKEWKFRNKAPSDIVAEISRIMRFLYDNDSYCSILFVDPSAKALKDEMTKVHIPFMNAMNSHSDGIGKLQSLFSLGKILIMDCCTELIGEIYSYSYKDTKSGKDEVIKVGDDLVDSMRYGIYTDSVVGR